MPIKPYGVLSARATERRRESGDKDSPHYQIHLVDSDGISFRAAVNVKSQQQPSDLLFLADDDFQHPVTAFLSGLASGWTTLASTPGGAALDFIRANLFDHALMRSVPADVTGVDNDLADLLDHYVLRAIGDPAAVLYVFGQRWGPENAVPDKVFGFGTGNGVHDVHMNQGNSGAFQRDNGIYQDGALLMHLPGENRWVAVFLAFQSQSWHTDERTGNPLVRPIDGSGGLPGSGSGSGVGSGREEKVRIVAALVNPTGPAPESETVTLINASPAALDLNGWTLADRLDHTCPVGAQHLAPGATTVVRLSNGMQLGNRGGLITVLDPDGIKVDGVSYTAEQAHREGWSVVF
jgi:uncharacterized protein YukJ